MEASSCDYSGRRGKTVTYIHQLPTLTVHCHIVRFVVTTRVAIKCSTIIVGKVKRQMNRQLYQFSSKIHFEWGVVRTLFTSIGS